MKVWLPEPASAFGVLPTGVEVSVYDGLPGGDVPSSLSSVEFYVTPYLGDSSTLEVICSMSSLRVIQTLTAGVEHVRPYLPDGVVLCNARGVHDAATSELAVALILASLRGLDDFVRGQDAHEWRHARHESLADKTVLIIGYGSIGAALEARLSGFECSVVRVARSARAGSPVVHGLSDLPLLLPSADVVVLLTPLTSETRGMVDAKFLASLKDGALLCNVARGGIVDTGALVDELVGGRLRAALDVTDPEPLPAGHPLWSAPGLVLSPHVGGNTSAFLPRSRRLVVSQLERFAAGQPLENVVNGTY